MIFPEYFHFTSQTRLPKRPNAHLNIIFNGTQRVKPSKQAENGLLIPWKRVIKQNGSTASVLKLLGAIKQFLVTHNGQDHT